MPKIQPERVVMFEINQRTASSAQMEAWKRFWQAMISRQKKKEDSRWMRS